MPSSLADDVREAATGAYGTVPNLFEETNRYTGGRGLYTLPPMQR